MNVFFNERCLSEIEDIESAIFFLNEALIKLSNEGINISCYLQEIRNWKNEYENLFDNSLRSKIFQIMSSLSDCESENDQFYYYYITHQDFNLEISENISQASIVNATNQILKGYETIMLNIPNSKFNSRPHVPILKSSHDFKVKDILANIPCFSNIEYLLSYCFLKKSIKPLFGGNENIFDTISKTCHLHFEKFKYHEWDPKTFLKDGKLDPNNLLPLIRYDLVKDIIGNIEIKRGSTEDNIASYKEYGGFILKLNGYYFNRKITNQYGYFTYEGGFGKNKLFMCIDIENSAFEVIERSGTHLGSYSYTGTFIKDYKTNPRKLDDHSFKNLTEDLFLFQ